MMLARTRLPFGIVAVVSVLGLSALGCDAGGLILVDEKENPPPPQSGVQANEIAAAGNVAKNEKYTIVHTLGQPTPQSRVKGGEKTLNGGIVGATQAP